MARRSPVTWRTVNPPNSTGALNVLSKAGTNIASAFEDTADALTDFGDTKTKLATEELLADLAALPDDQSRQALLETANKNFLDMGQVNEGFRDLQGFDFTKAEEAEKVLERKQAEENRGLEDTQRATTERNLALQELLAPGKKADALRRQATAEKDFNREQKTAENNYLASQDAAAVAAEARTHRKTFKGSLAQLTEARGTPEFVTTAAGILNTYKDNPNLTPGQQTRLDQIRKDALDEIQVSVENTTLGSILLASAGDKRDLASIDQNNLTTFTEEIRGQVENVLGPINDAQLAPIVAKAARAAGISGSIIGIKKKIAAQQKVEAAITAENIKQETSAARAATESLDIKNKYLADFNQDGGLRGHQTAVETLMDYFNSRSSKLGFNVFGNGQIGNQKFLEAYEMLVDIVRNKSGVIDEGELSWQVAQFLKKNTKINDNILFENDLEVIGNSDLKGQPLLSLSPEELFDLVTNRYENKRTKSDFEGSGS